MVIFTISSIPPLIFSSKIWRAIYNLKNSNIKMFVYNGLSQMKQVDTVAHASNG